ncbi:alpha-N-acetylgalactosaminide alpha-2,6-sialyltransferase 2-like [Leucoraja erinacea]|uniref:alpha-N-acetylgalactosaminide alpha-2,6-sialyltransferase 2-like n=1 Tax=Leucoraja erinaceus TaxID=7782 RepID=UPI00245876CC|nr:alpha-N-acetylgalactosaminide alpha-2,6-sialyltransferase 2-like [Leucoraja erinacea]XP_055509802.1 alpha-N-acetylgalactosaminide alpha-2,6-sialyltransferase 2-like [Leucoraja erinacea]XP_055509803.1 alpha-N-acetylgalactosaminide alpha-2,6-sialyltransferase 2-like [Leucoraja erinacea]
MRKLIVILKFVVMGASLFFLFVIYNQISSRLTPTPVDSKLREVWLRNGTDKRLNVFEKLDEPGVEVNFWQSSKNKETGDRGNSMKNISGPHATSKPTNRITTLSYLGDWYPTDIPHLQTQCPETARSRLVKVEEYADIFVGNVPVLQWSKHVTEKAYQRLKNYNGAHGWGVISYEDLKDTLSYLNTTANVVLFDDWERRSNKTSVCVRCAVVGNGGILNGSRKGKEIDGHDYVFRVNGAIIKGFEQDVGSRTSFYTFSTNTMKNSLYSYRRVGYTALPHSAETRYIFLPDHNRDYYLAKAAITNTAITKGKDKSQSPPTYFGTNGKAEKFKMYHPDFIRYVRNRFLKGKILSSRHRDIYRPSTGATMLLAAIHSCDEVTAYGFMTEDYANYSDHYFDRTYHKVVFYSNHDMKMEMRLWKKLNDYKVINLYTRKNNGDKMKR